MALYDKPEGNTAEIASLFQLVNSLKARIARLEQRLLDQETELREHKVETPLDHTQGTTTITGSIAATVSQNFTLAELAFFPSLEIDNSFLTTVRFFQRGGGAAKTDQVGRFMMSNNDGSTKNYRVSYKYLS